MIEFPRPVVRLIRTLNEAGYEAYAVGGCVRDALLGRQPNDWDLTTSALPEQIKACFANRRVIETGIKHGTVTVLDGGVPYEITTYRLDGAYSDHRRPDSVEFVSDLKEDLRRRDFTVNAMACHPETGVVDLFGGQDDLRAGVIRCVGEPEHRFTEDALRILRALRFASTYDFAIAPATGRAALKLAPTLKNVSPERIFVELKKLLCGKGARRVLAEYSDILFTIFPALAPMRGCAQNNPHHAYDVWTHTLIALENAPADPVYRLTMLFHDSGKPAAHTVGEDGYDHFKGHPAISRDITEAALFAMKSDRATMNRVLALITEHDLRIPAEPKSVRRQMARIGSDLFEALFPVFRADLLAQNPAMIPEKLRAEEALERVFREEVARNVCVKISDLAVNGRDLMALGITGPDVGRTLKTLLDKVVSEELPNEREALLAACQTRRPDA